MIKVIRTATVPVSLNFLLKGQLKYLSSRYEVVAVSGEDANLREVEMRENIRVYPISMRRNISFFNDIVSLWKLYCFFRKEKPQIVHSITPKAGLLSMTAAYFSGVPVRMHTFTGLIFPSKRGMMQKLLIYMDRLICFFATSIYPEGNGVLNDLKKYKITRKPLKVIANGNINGLDLNYFNPALFEQNEKEQLKLELGINNEFVFIFVGRLVGDKGINELVSAFKLISGLYKAKLLLVGSYENDLDPLQKRTLEEINNNSNIISVGFQSDVRPFFGISDCLVFPSYREGFPNVVLQAGAMGLPSIVSNINGCNEIIENEINGIIIPAKDKDALYKAMVRTLNENVDKLKEKSRDLIIKRYEQSIVWDALLKEYEKQIALQT